jgi:protein phosphatase
MSESSNPDAAIEQAFELALLSDVGTDRPGNEDCCGKIIDGDGSVVFAVADGVGGYEGGEVASQMAIELTLKAFSESPREWGSARRLARAVQNANIAIHNRALAVPELCRMATTLTAVAINQGMLSAAHCGDCRLYLVHRGRITQLSRDHTMIGERVRMGLMSKADARNHPERSALSRSLGRDLIVSLDRISLRLARGDRLILCSDGLYGVLEDHELESMTHDGDAAAACARLVETANARGTVDNLTAAVFRMLSEPAPDTRAGGDGLFARLRGFFRRNR